MLSMNFSFTQAVQLLGESQHFYFVKVDTLGRYVYMNDHFISRHKSFYNHTDIRPASIALHPDDHALSYATYLKCVESPGQSFGATLRKLDGKGGYVITYWEYTADLLPDGQPDGVIGIGYDITAFESRKEHIHFLTETLNNIALKQSHDIRRPLANVLGLAELLNIASQDNEEIKELADKLVQSCKELNHEFELFITNDLIEVNKPNSF